MLKKYILVILKILLPLFGIGLIYLITLFFPQPFFKYNYSFNNITVYSDERINEEKLEEILKEVESNIKKSEIYKEDTKHNIFITNNPLRWKYFTNIYQNVGGLNYVLFNHNVFLRQASIEENRLYNSLGNQVPGDRTLSYFMAHELTHTLEFQSMRWYKYPIQTNWVLEGYCEYIAHGSQPYESSLDYYLHTPETQGAKYYTRVRTMVTYLLEEKDIKVEDLWSKVNEYDQILKESIPNDQPRIVD